MPPADDLRRVVLDASLDLVAAEGLGALSLREVARRAGVSHQAPYHHFKDREAILAALAAEGYTRVHERMITAANAAATPMAKLEAVGRVYITFALENPALFKMMHQSELVPLHQHADALGCARRTFEMLVGLVETAAVQRGLNADSNALAVTAWSLVHGAATLLLEQRLQLKFPNAEDREEAAIDAVLRTYGRLFEPA